MSTAFYPLQPSFGDGRGMKGVGFSLSTSKVTSDCRDPFCVFRIPVSPSVESRNVNRFLPPPALFWRWEGDEGGGFSTINFQGHLRLS